MPQDRFVINVLLHSTTKEHGDFPVIVLTQSTMSPSARPLLMLKDATAILTTPRLAIVVSPSTTKLSSYNQNVTSDNKNKNVLAMIQLSQQPATALTLTQVL
jgi:hypothetical protein